VPPSVAVEGPSNKKTVYARYFKSTRGYEHDVVVESPGAKPIWANGNTSDTGLETERQCEAALDLSEVLGNVVEVIKVDCDLKQAESPPMIEPSNVTDDVNHPAHYNAGGIECIDAIEAMLPREQFIGFLRGQVVKYQWRMGRKGDAAQDAGKAEWYAARLAKVLAE
jgi:hypothetical protein